jgi:hypothetical protein
LTIHAEFRSGSRDIDNPPFFASRSEKKHWKEPSSKESRLLIHKALPQSDLPVGIDSELRAQIRDVAFATCQTKNYRPVNVLLEPT